MAYRKQEGIIYLFCVLIPKDLMRYKFSERNMHMKFWSQALCVRKTVCDHELRVVAVVFITYTVSRGKLNQQLVRRQLSGGKRQEDSGIRVLITLSC